MFVSAIIAAAGKGTRMGANISKQYLNLEGKPILIHTLRAFDNCPSINEIILVISPDEETFLKDLILKPYRFKKDIKIAYGGYERQESIYNGLKYIDTTTKIIAIHDGARPLITQEIIVNSIESAAIYGAVVAAVPVKDTIKVVDSKGYVTDTPVRKRLWAAQTPQTFTKEILFNAYEKAMKENYFGTDDSTLVERMGIRVKLIPGSYDNIKITTPHDLVLAQGIMRRR
jgi:2-C-methyl-D-erythritol 4-phosphate cytidylyltransferase